MLSPGSEFAHYRVEKHLGEGGMGTVYMAVDNRLDRVVALKLIHQKLARQEDYRIRLAEEAKIAARIDSPNVVRVWEHAVYDGIPYISLEYVSGKELRDLADQLDLEQKTEVMRQMAEGIKAAHDVGLIHRDLKPENVRITEDGKAKIFDFGLAKAVRPDAADEDSKIEGTLHYLSPEQLSGENLTFSSDLFSFGTILYELFAGQRPFEGEFAASIIYSILNEEPLEPIEHNDEIPPWINDLIMKLLNKSPADRFESIDAVLEHIGKGLSGELAPAKKEVLTGRQSVTIVDIKNLSDDPSWSFFCDGFSNDVIQELSRRTDLIATARPADDAPKDIKACFDRFETDYIIIGSLMKWQENVRLNVSVYGDEGKNVVFDESYEAPANNLFKLFADAARNISISLAARRLQF